MKVSSSDDIGSGMMHLLHRVGQLAEERFAHAMGDDDLTHRQLVILAVVDNLTDPSQTDLCAVTGIDRSTLADVVRRLVDRGMLTRKRTKEDARRYAVNLTSNGRQALAKARPIWRSVEKEFTACLTPDELKQFSTCISKLLKAKS